MSYRCELIADKNIKCNEIEDIVSHLPDKLSNPVGNSTQSWGWSCGCDIYNPENNKLVIGGSYSISGAIAEEFVEHIIKELNKKGYKISKEWNY